MKLTKEEVESKLSWLESLSDAELESEAREAANILLDEQRSQVESLAFSTATSVGSVLTEARLCEAKANLLWLSYERKRRAKNR